MLRDCHYLARAAHIHLDRFGIVFNLVLNSSFLLEQGDDCQAAESEAPTVASQLCPCAHEGETSLPPLGDHTRFDQPGYDEIEPLNLRA